MLMNMKKFIFTICLVLAIILSPVLEIFASGWPADPAGTDISVILKEVFPAFEPSGVVYISARDSMVVVSDEGEVAELTKTGLVKASWDLGSAYDLEDVAVGLAGNLVYLAEENTSRSYAFNLDTGALTGWYVDFSAYITEVGGSNGIEGLTFVPDGVHAHGVTSFGGLFYAGWQEDGDIYVFDADPGVAGAGIFKEEIHMTSGYTDLSALYYSPVTNKVYAGYDGLNILESRTPDGTFIDSFNWPGTNQEGITLTSTAGVLSAVTAEDSGLVMTYNNFLDPALEDGLLEDGLLVAYTIEYPNGLDDDGDGIIDEMNTVAENGLHPVYGSHNPAVNSDITSVAGSLTGAVTVTFVDGSKYLYQPFLSGEVIVSVYPGTAYLKVKKVGGSKLWLNGLTGLPL